MHELLVVPEADVAYVPIFGDGIHGRNPNPGQTLHVIDLIKRKVATSIDLAPYRGPHTVRRGHDGLIYITCETSAVVAVIDPNTHKMIDAIASGSTNGHRLCLAGRRPAALHRQRGRRDGFGDRRAEPQADRQNPTPQMLAGIGVSADGKTVIAVSDEQPVIFVIDTAAGKVVREVRLEGVDKAAQIVRYSPDGSFIAVSNLNSNAISLIDPSFEQADRRHGRQPADGHGVSRRRVIRRLSGRRHDPCHRHRQTHAQDQLQGRHRLRIRRLFLATTAQKNRPPQGRPIHFTQLERR